MKKARDPQFEQLKPAVLYYDDLEKILEIMKQACERVEVRAGGYQLDDLSEIKSLNETLISNVEFDGYNPSISVNLKENTISVWTSDSTPIQVGLSEQLKKFIHKRRRKLAWLTHSVVAPGIMLGIATPLLKKEPTAYNVTLTFAIIILAALWFWWSYHGSIKRYAIIYPKEVRSAGSILTRKKDDIVLALVSATIGAVLSALATKFIG